MLTLEKPDGTPKSTRRFPGSHRVFTSLRNKKTDSPNTQHFEAQQDRVGEFADFCHDLSPQWSHFATTVLFRWFLTHLEQPNLPTDVTRFKLGK